MSSRAAQPVAAAKKAKKSPSKPRPPHGPPSQGEPPLPQTRLPESRDSTSEYRKTLARGKDRATGVPKTIRKMRPGTKALKEIRKYQKVPRHEESRSDPVARAPRSFCKSSPSNAWSVASSRTSTERSRYACRRPPCWRCRKRASRI